MQAWRMAFAITLEFDDAPEATPGSISGRVVANGSGQSFTGWLGLLAELDRAVRRGSESANDAELHLVRDRIDGVEHDLSTGPEPLPGPPGDGQ